MYCNLLIKASLSNHQNACCKLSVAQDLGWHKAGKIGLGCFLTGGGYQIIGSTSLNEVGKNCRTTMTLST